MIDRVAARTVVASRQGPDEIAAGFTGDARSVDVWVFNRTSPSFAALAEQGPVSDEERARAARLRGPGLASDLLSRRAAARRVLARYLRREAESILIVTLPGGKPVLKPRAGDPWALAHSMSHSADVFCVAVGTASSLGVDVERRRRIPRALPIAMRWFSREESSRLRRMPDARFSDTFVELWTGKEALAKRHAAGLRLMRRGSESELDVHWESARGTLVHFEPLASYRASLASTEPIEQLRLVFDACVEV